MLQPVQKRPQKGLHSHRVEECGFTSAFCWRHPKESFLPISSFYTASLGHLSERQSGGGSRPQNKGTILALAQLSAQEQQGVRCHWVFILIGWKAYPSFLKKKKILLLLLLFIYFFYILVAAPSSFPFSLSPPPPPTTQPPLFHLHPGKCRSPMSINKLIKHLPFLFFFF